MVSLIRVLRCYGAIAGESVTSLDTYWSLPSGYPCRYSTSMHLVVSSSFPHMWGKTAPGSCERFLYGIIRHFVTLVLCIISIGHM